MLIVDFLNNTTKFIENFTETWRMFQVPIHDQVYRLLSLRLQNWPRIGIPKGSKISTKKAARTSLSKQ